jgi:hypothetical protein
VILKITVSIEKHISKSIEPIFLPYVLLALRGRDREREGMVTTCSEDWRDKALWNCIL